MIGSVHFSKGGCQRGTACEKKTLIRALTMPRPQRDDYHLLSRKQQVILVRLRIGHNRLNSHMHRKLKLPPSPTCPCGQEEQTTEHVRQRCPPSQSYQRRCVACQHFPDDLTLRLQAGAGEDDIIHLPSGLDRVDCERQEEEEEVRHLVYTGPSLRYTLHVAKTLSKQETNKHSAATAQLTEQYAGYPLTHEIYSKKKVPCQEVFFRDAPQLVWSFSPAQPCARYSTCIQQFNANCLSRSIQTDFIPLHFSLWILFTRKNKSG